MQDDRSDTKPEWWSRNEAIKRDLELPRYEPPRFENGVYTHEMLSALEEAHGCTIQFQGQNTLYPEDWHVVVDGEPAFAVGRYRDENGNTVYTITDDEFKSRFEEYVSDE